jgi:hypothetical protein
MGGSGFKPEPARDHSGCTATTFVGGNDNPAFHFFAPAIFCSLILENNVHSQMDNATIT